ncbi:uncharacterized protein LOC123212526 [Mangifera indica]|uniref:uncharacterized protein LOC123212526 n=1 Tax=Mangifera indica TaxID=29780 RepID=UPI001CF93B69|nr:uncharacterized protein LOC123212526 [Mangifera indica]
MNIIYGQGQPCIMGEKTVKAVAGSQLHDSDTDKSQNHHPNSVNGGKNEGDNAMIDVFCRSHCKKALAQKVMRSLEFHCPLSMWSYTKESGVGGCAVVAKWCSDSWKRVHPCSGTFSIFDLWNRSRKGQKERI